MRRRTALQLVASIVVPVAVIAAVTSGAGGAGGGGARTTDVARSGVAAPGTPRSGVATGTWSVAAAADPLVATGTLSAVSCPAAGWCAAVGTYDGPAARGLTLAEVQAGGRWVVTPSPSPPGAVDAVLSGISCVSATACVAVGNATDDAGASSAVSETWDGHSWHLQPVPLPPATATSALYGISCTGVDSCMAVGRRTGRGAGDSAGGAALAERWDGSVWVATAPPGGIGTGELFGVSCPAADACMAVGAGTARDGLTAAVADRWDGRRWSRLAVPPPAATATTALASVSCPSPRLCEAVGNATDDSSIEVDLLEGWDGRAWRARPTGSGATPHSLDGVSCPSTRRCIAVGTYDDAAAASAPSTAQWDGSTWTLDDLTDPDPVPAAATGTGTPGSSTAGALGVGTAPSGVGVPAGSGTELGAVSCSAARACTAVGATSARSGTGTAAEVWNGASWTPSSTPDPHGPATSALQGVSCSAVTSCTAVGDTIDGAGTEVPLAEVWNGRTWSVEPAPAPPGAVASALEGVSCPTADDCVAVGGATLASDAEVTLAEVWDGRRWRLVATTDPPGASTSALAAVSCPAVDRCVAVGATTDDTGAEVSLAESWDGRTWRTEGTPNPPDATSSDLYSVTCNAPGRCRAAGVSTNDNGTSFALAENLAGGAWALGRTTPALAAAPGTLHGVWCATPSACLAVGASSGPSDTSQATAAVWDGHAWRSRPVATPAGSTSSSLSGLSCRTVDACIAVGTYSDASGTVLALAEVWRRPG